MKPLTCIIVDDEPLAIRLLESFIEKTSCLKLLASFSDPIEAMNAIGQLKPDLLFLDIQMPQVSGMELARTLPQETRVIFTTAFKEYAFESYEVHALDYLLKPVRYSKFREAVERAVDHFGRSQPTEPQELGQDGEIHSQPTTLFIRVNGELRNIPTRSILYVSGMKDYVMFYLEGERKPLITHLTMKAVEEMLPPPHFMRVHRSYIVAVDKIDKVDRNDCIYIGDEIIHVPDGYLDAFRSFVEKRMPATKPLTSKKV